MNIIGVLILFLASSPRHGSSCVVPYHGRNLLTWCDSTGKPLYAWRLPKDSEQQAPPKKITYKSDREQPTLLLQLSRYIQANGLKPGQISSECSVEWRQLLFPPEDDAVYLATTNCKTADGIERTFFLVGGGSHSIPLPKSSAKSARDGWTTSRMAERPLQDEVDLEMRSGIAVQSREGCWEAPKP